MAKRKQDGELFIKKTLCCTWYLDQVSGVWKKLKLEPEPEETFSSFGQTIMEDDSTADFIIRCKSKAFHVHKNFFCARSPVFRAAMLSDMAEGKSGEMFISDFDEKTLGTVVKYVYTGQIEMAEGQDLQMLIQAADMYQLPRLITLVCNQMREADINGERIADLLISAYKHGKEELRELAVERIRANREICEEDGFKERMDNFGAPAAVWVNILKDL